MAGGMNIIEHLEFHDSTLAAVRTEGDLLLQLRPGYIHHWEHDGLAWTGVGRLQDVQLRLIAGRFVGKMAETETDIADGTISVDDATFENLVPVPFRRHGRVAARLELADGSILEATATGVVVETIGPSKDLEPLPAEWAPTERAADAGSKPEPR